jgi:hypothetical protein
MNASRSRTGSFISGRSVEIVTTAEVFDGAEGALARSVLEDVAIGAMVVSGERSIGLASDWLTFWLTPASFGREAVGSTFRGGEDVCRPLTCRRAPAAWEERAGATLVGRDGSLGMIKMSSSPIGTRRTTICGEPEGGAHRNVGSPGLSPPWGIGPDGRAGNPFDSRLNSAVNAQIATKLIGTIARRINWSQFIGEARGFPRKGPGPVQELTGSRRALLVPVPAIELRISVSAWTLRRL